MGQNGWAKPDKVLRPIGEKWNHTIVQSDQCALRRLAVDTMGQEELGF